MPEPGGGSRRGLLDVRISKGMDALARQHEQNEMERKERLRQIGEELGTESTKPKICPSCYTIEDGRLHRPKCKIHGRGMG